MSDGCEGSAMEVLPAAATAAVPHRRERLPQWLGLKIDADGRLDDLRVAVIGNGSVGLAIALAMSRLQVGGLLLADHGRFKMASLLTHDISPRDAALAHQKALYAAKTCRQISPRTLVTAYAGSVQSMPMDALVGCDLVVLATDNVAAEVDVGKRCLRQRKPLYHASVHGETLTAQVRVYRNADAAGACPACSLNRAEIESLNAAAQYKCDGSGVATPTAPAAAVPTRSVSSLCSLAADLAVIEVLKHVLELGPKRGDYVLEYAGYTNKTTVTTLAPRKGTCICDHDTVWLPARPPRRLAACSPWELATAAGFPSDLRGVSFAVDQLVFAQAGVCACGMRRRIGRFLAPGARGPEDCSVCRKPVYSDAFFSHRPVASEYLKDAVHRPLQELGAVEPRCVLVAANERAALFTDRADGGATDP